MQSASVLLFLFGSLVAFGKVEGADDCAPKPGEKLPDFGGCCNLDEYIPDEVKGLFKKCSEKFTKPPRPSTPPSGPDAALRDHLACMSECVFSEGGLLTDDKKVDKAAVSEKFETDDSVMGPIVKAALAKTLGSFEKDIDSSAKCKSGTFELMKALAREVFLNCPSDRWTSSSECTQLKSKVTKCPKFQVFLGGGEKD